MRSVDEHMAEVLAGIGPIAAFHQQLIDAHGCLLDEDVAAPVDLPSFDNSAMDGYAVRAADVEGATELVGVVLPVVGDIAAGDLTEWMLAPGTTARIMTGAPIPAGADSVVPVEWTDGGVSEVEIRRVPEIGQHIRTQGDDVKVGETVLRHGTWLGPTQIGLLAAIGQGRVSVRPRPRVVVISTGSELIEPGSHLESGQVFDANSYMLTAAAVDAGAIAYRVGIIGDDAAELKERIEDQLIRADLLITSGGVSKGAYDLVKQVLADLGNVSFHEVAMQPGKPQGYGHIGPDRTPVFALPGNPVSAYVSFEVFVRPLIRRMLALEPLYRPTVTATCLQPLTSSAGIRQYARGLLSFNGDEGPDSALEGAGAAAATDGADDKPVGTVTPVGGHGSHLLGDLAQANALIVLPEWTTSVQVGDTVQVMVLERRTGP
ncbi:MAG TPA: gephyrin-like molybdotransferase Glp [Actinomycetes bacterium]|nr:gephyrin-like molybdotransferase Glp [Actinomycetes bacterium]